MSGAGRFTLTEDLGLTYFAEADKPASLAAVALATELTANGINLIGALNGEGLAAGGVSGWEPSSSSIPVPDYGTNEVGTIAGTTSYPDSSLDFYKHKTIETIYSGIVKGATGYVLWAYTGNIAGEQYEIFPVTVQSVVRMKGNNEGHKFRISFAIGVPTLGTLAT